MKGKWRNWIARRGQRAPQGKRWVVPCNCTNYPSVKGLCAAEMEFCYGMDAVRLKNIWEWQFHYRNVIVSFWHYSSCFTSSSPGEDESPPFRIFYCADLSFLIFFVLFLAELFRLWLYSETTFPCVELSPSHLWWSGFWDAQSYASINLFDMLSVLFMVSHFLFMPWCASSRLIGLPVLMLLLCAIFLFASSSLFWAEKGCCFSLIC